MELKWGQSFVAKKNESYDRLESRDYRRSKRKRKRVEQEVRMSNHGNSSAVRIDQPREIDQMWEDRLQMYNK